MKYEPFINRTRLSETIRDRYGLPVETLMFVPVGFDAVCYVMQCVDGARYFLKLWPDTSVGRASAARRATILRLTRALYERRLYPCVPYPIPTRDGALWVPFAGASFAIFPFLVGHAPPPQWPAALRDEWARTMATIHRATPTLTDVLPPREASDIPFEADLRRGLETLERIGVQERPGLLALRDLVLPRRKKILDQVARLHRLQNTVRQLSGPVVLCHTDMGGDNLLVDEAGRLSVVDWDGATVAPPEHDLHEARWGDFGRVLEVYRAAGGAGPLYLDHFAFYLLRRHLNDMTVRLLRMLEEHTSADEAEDLLDGIQAWGFAQWSTLDRTLAGIAAALAQSN